MEIFNYYATKQGIIKVVTGSRLLRVSIITLHGF